VGRAINDFGATYHSALVVLGDRLGLYRALAGVGDITSAELATATGTSERYVREWLNAQAAGGYIDFDPLTKRYHLSPEQALLLADKSSPAFVVGGFEAAVAAVGVQPRLLDAFRTGDGIGWHEHGDGLFGGVERFFRSGYAQHLVSKWIPALSGVEDRLLAGARVADVGCGHGAATILVAQAYPRSTFVGFSRPAIEKRHQLLPLWLGPSRLKFACLTARAHAAKCPLCRHIAPRELRVGYTRF
jgi:hypothetical protein